MDSQSAFKGCLDVWFLVVEYSGNQERANLRLTDHCLSLIAARGLFDKVVVKLGKLAICKHAMSKHLHQVSELTIVTQATSTRRSLEFVPIVLRSMIAAMLPLKTVHICNETMHQSNLAIGAIKKNEETSSVELKILLMVINMAFDSLGRSLDSFNIPGNGQQRFAFSQYKIPILGLHPSPSFVRLKRFRFDVHIIANPKRVVNADLLKWLPMTLAAMRGTLEELALDFEYLKNRGGGQFNVRCMRHKSAFSTVWWDTLGLHVHWPAIKHLSLTNVQHRPGQVARFIAANCDTLRSVYLGTWQCATSHYLLTTFPQPGFISELAVHDNKIIDKGIEITFEGHSSKSKHICRRSFPWVNAAQSHWYWKVTYRELLRDYFSLFLRVREVKDCYAYPVDLICRTTRVGKWDESRSVMEHENTKKRAQALKEQILRQREMFLQANMVDEEY